MSSPPPYSTSPGLDPTDFKIQQKMLEDPSIPTKVLGRNFNSSGITFVGHMAVSLPSLSCLAWRMFLLLLKSNPSLVSEIRVSLIFFQSPGPRAGLERFHEDCQDASIRSRSSGCYHEKFFFLRVGKSKIAKCSHNILYKVFWPSEISLVTEFWRP